VCVCVCVYLTHLALTPYMQLPCILLSDLTHPYIYASVAFHVPWRQHEHSLYPMCVVEMRGGRSFGMSPREVPYLLSPVPNMGVFTWIVSAHVCCDPNQSPSCHQGERPSKLARVETRPPIP